MAGTAMAVIRPSVVAATPAGPTISVGNVVNLSQETGNQFEGSVAIDPSNSNRIFVLGRDETGNLIGSRSSDGGATWTHSRMGTCTCSTDKLPPGWGNASVAFDRFGNLFVVYLSTTAFTYTDFALSTDGGATFSHQQALASLTDQPVVATGNGSVWVTYNRGGVNTVVGASVTGLGSIGSFGTPEAVPGANASSFGDISVGPQGQVMVAFGPNASTGGVVVSVDPDGLGPLGFTTATEVAPTNVPGFDLIPAAPNWGVDSEAHLAWDQSGGTHDGRVYLAFLDAPSSDLNNTMLYVMHSDDGGATWSAPVLVNDDGTAASHFMPGFAVDQTTGAVGATWYDTRGDSTRVNAAYYGSVSIDGGDTWSTNFPISAATSNATHATPPAPIRNTNFGDYTGLAFHGGVMVPIWADNSNSTGDNPAGAAASFDLYTALVQVTVPATAAAVTSSPSSTTVASGSTYSFTASGSGSPIPAVQWQRSDDGGTTFTDIVGATSTTYSNSSVVTDSGAQFRAVFTNSTGSATTTAATLTVTTAAAVTSSPSSTTVASGSTYSFTASGSGSPIPAVQWQRSDDGGTTFTDIVGATSTTYSNSSVVTDSGAQFRAVFTNSTGSATTTAATLTVTTTTSMTLTVGHTSIRAGKSDPVTVVITSPVTGRAKVAVGIVTIYDGARVIAFQQVSKGKIKVNLTFAAGSHVLRAVYSGSGLVLAAQSLPVTVTAA